MIIAISGVPGTGKSIIAKSLAKEMNANLISIKKLLSEIPHKYDRKRRTKIIDTKDLQKAVNKKIIKGTNVIEGHLSHLLKSDIVIILRCNPKELNKRLKKRGWSELKIRENVQAEILDEITIEALEKHRKKKVFEIDTSRKKVDAIGIIKKILNKYPTHKRYLAGRIDWSEKYKKELIWCGK